MLYDWDNDSFLQEISLTNDKIIIIEGVNSADKSIKSYIDYSIFIKAKKEKRLQRVLKRGDFTLKEFKVWQKSEKEIFKDKILKNILI